jgi:hypothetical protein
MLNKIYNILQIYYSHSFDELFRINSNETTRSHVMLES